MARFAVSVVAFSRDKAKETVIETAFIPLSCVCFVFKIQEAPPKQKPRTLESTRDVDHTVVKPTDEEVFRDEAEDEFARFFSNEEVGNETYRGKNVVLRRVARQYLGSPKKTVTRTSRGDGFSLLTVYVLCSSPRLDCRLVRLVESCC